MNFSKYGKKIQNEKIYITLFFLAEGGRKLVRLLLLDFLALMLPRLEGELVPEVGVAGDRRDAGGENRPWQRNAITIHFKYTEKQ